jgi:hypothetical protein
VEKIVMLFEMSDRKRVEQGFELLVSVDDTNTLDGTWRAVDKLLGQEGEGCQASG